MRDYDEDRRKRHEEREKLLGDRSFKLGGETFTFKANVSSDVLRRMTGESEFLTGASYISAIEESCLDFIEDSGDAHDRFRDLVKRQEDPITMDDLQAVFTGLVEDAFQRPTQAPSLSGDGRETTGPSSTETLSTEQAEELVA